MQAARVAPLALAAAVAAAAAAHAAEHTLPANKDTVHWGYFSKDEPPVLTVASGDTVDIEMLSHHAGDDPARMIDGDAGVESVYKWAPGEMKKRGATNMNDGVHILTGPIYVEEAEPGDVIAVEILDLEPRPNPDGKTFGSNAAAWWGFEYGMNGKAPPSWADEENKMEVATIYEAVKDESGKTIFAKPVYSFKYGSNPIELPCIGVAEGQPFENFTSVVPGLEIECVNGTQSWTGYYWPGLLTSNPDIITEYGDDPPFKVPVNLHIGCMGLAPAAPSIINSIPPMPNGGNLDNRRIGVGATMYYPVKVAGGLLSMGDTHLAQGDSELDGTGIETSLNGKIKISLLKKADLPPYLEDLSFPLLENENEYVVHGFTFKDYIKELGYDTDAPTGNVFLMSNVDQTMANTYEQTRDFIMSMGFTEAEARTMITTAVDFSTTQLVDGNWGMHGTIPKYLFESDGSAPYEPSTYCGTSMPQDETLRKRRSLQGFVDAIEEDLGDDARRAYRAFMAQSVGGQKAQAGCTYKVATNYDPEAVRDDGSCKFDFAIL